jgi:AmiR/NasT family two-component response regulator
MERYNIDNEAAFRFLARASSHSNVKLRDVAQQLIEDSTRQRGQTPEATG